MKHYLFVDDDVIFNVIHSKSVSMVDESAQITTYSSSTQALDYIVKMLDQNMKMPDYVFFDINMPQLTGFELIDRVIEKYPTAFDHSICFILSSSLDERDFERAKKYSFIQDFLGKPLVKNKIEKILNS
jgi:two-component SAPR family response regulator